MYQTVRYLHGQHGCLELQGFLSPQKGYELDMTVHSMAVPIRQETACRVCAASWGFPMEACGFICG